MKNNILRKNIFVLLIGIIVLSVISLIYLYSKNINNYDKKDVEFVSVKSDEDWKKIITGKIENESNELLKMIFNLPYSALINKSVVNSENSTNYVSDSDFSKTNSQVENLDEADVIKTDGEYIYSISNSSIIISKTDITGKIEIVSEINTTDIPEEFLIKDNKLIVISDLSSRLYDTGITTIEIYDTLNKGKVNLIKKIKVDKKYYTSRMIGDKIYILTNGDVYSRNSNDYVPSYSIDGVETKMPYDKIKYMKSDKDNNSKISILTTIDINDLTRQPDFNCYLMPIGNAYMSENNMYIVYNKYENTKKNEILKNIKSLFSLGGIPKVNQYMLNYYVGANKYRNYTSIIKFGFTNTGIEYLSKVKEVGSVCDKSSIDEYNGNLRVTLNKSVDNSNLLVFSNKMKKIGELDNIAQGEEIYTTRFIKDRAYVVKNKTMDPLFVIDLKEPTNPKILGELKIPGYSTYLHPYDENHIIGIGNVTEEKIITDANGKTSSKRAVITGMKMAIFDVTDVKNPKEQFSQKIGDRTTYSTILKNHKALLFSKEKELLAIPINNYKEDIAITTSESRNLNVSNNQITSEINSVDNIKTKPIKSGYIVYNINLTDGFKEKGVITHDTLNKKGEYWYTENNQVRGVYIGDNLYTVSEGYIKSNSLDKLEEKSSIQLGR